jgi:hypothetical protein
MFRLPEGWSKPSKLDDFIVIEGVKVHRAGIASTAPTGEQVVGAAADRAGPARDRAWFELAERVCILQAIGGPRKKRRLYTDDGAAVGEISHAAAFPVSRSPTRWVYARSNGVAIHRDWKTACRRAFWELAERDRVLRAWRGELRPVSVRLPRATACAENTHEWIACAFPAPEGSWAAKVHVIGVFALPRSKGAPFAAGFAARPMKENALHAALGEATQQLAFLWDERVPSRAPKLRPSPSLHLDTYQLYARQDRIRAWLDGGHLQFRPPKTGSIDDRAAPITFVDLTAPWLGNGNDGPCVAKAVCASALPLAFGDSPTMRHLPEGLRIHPIA